MRHSKKCFKCLEIKSISEFYKNKGMSDGHLNKCKTCTKLDVSKNYLKNREYYRSYEKERNQLQYRKEARTNYQKTPGGRERCNLAKKRYIEKDKVKARAHSMTSNAIRNKKLHKQPCEICGAIKAEAHHDDYSKPLEVRWLCKKHHMEHHWGPK